MDLLKTAFFLLITLFTVAVISKASERQTDDICYDEERERCKEKDFYCGSRTEFMSKHCRKTCKMCSPGDPLKLLDLSSKCASDLAKYGQSYCLKKEWASICPYSCQDFVCKDKAPEECKPKASDGECLSKHISMTKNCKLSCAMCEPGSPVMDTTSVCRAKKTLCNETEWQEICPHTCREYTAPTSGQATQTLSPLPPQTSNQPQIPSGQAIPPQQANVGTQSVQLPQSNAIPQAVTPQQPNVATQPLQPPQSNAVQGITPQQPNVATQPMQPPPSNAVQGGVTSQQPNVTTQPMKPPQSNAVQGVTPQQPNVATQPVKPPQSNAVQGVTPQQPNVATQPVQPQRSNSVSQGTSPQQANVVTQPVQPQQSNVASQGSLPQQSNSWAQSQSQSSDGMNQVASPLQKNAMQQTSQPSESSYSGALQAQGPVLQSDVAQPGIVPQPFSPLNSNSESQQRITTTQSDSGMAKNVGSLVQGPPETNPQQQIPADSQPSSTVDLSGQPQPQKMLTQTTAVRPSQLQSNEQPVAPAIKPISPVLKVQQLDSDIPPGKSPLARPFFQSQEHFSVQVPPRQKLFRTRKKQNRKGKLKAHSTNANASALDVKQKNSERITTRRKNHRKIKDGKIQTKSRNKTIDRDMKTRVSDTSKNIKKVIYSEKKKNKKAIRAS
ncbi:uncharacterized protein [Montipora foliosa]